MGKNFTLEAVKRPVRFVPSSKYIKSLLTEFRQARSHLAVVVNEYGATIGIVTLEDCIETLLGVEIMDESDKVADMRELAKNQLGQKRRAEENGE